MIFIKDWRIKEIGGFMNKLTKLFMVGAFSSVLSVVPVRAGTLNFQTYFKVKTVKFKTIMMVI